MSRGVASRLAACYTRVTTSTQVVGGCTAMVAEAREPLNEDLTQAQQRKKRRKPVPRHLPGNLARRYRILSLLGRGANGEVVEAWDLVEDRPVALKILLRERARKATTLDRFFREATALGRLEHPGIVKVFDTGVDASGLHYLAMELVQGDALLDVLAADGRLPALTVARLGYEVCEVIQVAHSMKIVHRDLKPANLLLPDGWAEGREHIRVVDFGTVKMVAGEDEGVPGRKLTRDGDVIGTPQYIAPEQAAGRPVDGRADLYSLGCIMYEALSGHVPFDGDNQFSILLGHMEREPVRLDQLVGRDDIPTVLADFVACLLAKQPDDRPVNAAAAAAELRNMTEDLPGEHSGRDVSSPLRWRENQPIPGLPVAVLASVTPPPAPVVQVSTTDVTHARPAVVEPVAEPQSPLVVQRTTPSGLRPARPASGIADFPTAVGRSAPAPPTPTPPPTQRVDVQRDPQAAVMTQQVEFDAGAPLDARFDSSVDFRPRGGGILMWISVALVIVVVGLVIGVIGILVYDEVNGPHTQPFAAADSGATAAADAAQADARAATDAGAQTDVTTLAASGADADRPDAAPSKDVVVSAADADKAVAVTDDASATPAQDVAVEPSVDAVATSPVTKGIEIVSTPAGATVFHHTKELGLAPVVDAVGEPSTYPRLYIVTMRGRESQMVMVSADDVADGTHKIEVDLPPRRAGRQSNLELITEPGGAEVIDAGKYVGLTPAHLGRPISLGTVDLELRDGAVTRKVKLGLPHGHFIVTVKLAGNADPIVVPRPDRP